MNNVVHIDQFKATRHSRKQPDFDGPIFLGGVCLTLIVPTATYIALGGPVAPIAFAFTILTGIILGLVNYLYFPYQVISCVDTKPPSRSAVTGTTTPPTTGVSNKKAA
jgi:hypothetical protein